MLETDTEKNSSYGSKPALPRAGEQKKRACEEFQYDFSNGTKRSEARPEETYFYGENQPMMFEEAVKAKNGGGSKNAEKGLAVFLTVVAVLLVARTGRRADIVITAVAGIALRERKANNLSRHSAMPGRRVSATMFSRDRKKVVSIMLNSNPACAHKASAAGRSGSSLKPYCTVTCQKCSPSA